MFFDASFLKLEKWLRAQSSLLRLIAEAQWSCTVISKWTGIYISWLTPPELLRLGLAWCCHGMDQAQLIPTTTQQGPHLLTSPPTTIPCATLIRCYVVARRSRRQLPSAGSHCLGWGQWWPCHLSSFQRSPHHCLTYVRFCSNIWANISLHSRCN